LSSHRFKLLDCSWVYFSCFYSFVFLPSSWYVLTAVFLIMRIQSRLTMVVKNEWRACQLQIPKFFFNVFNVVSRRTYNYLLKRILNSRMKYNRNFLWRTLEVLGLIDYNKLVFLNNWNKIKRVFFCSKNKRISIVLLERVFSKIY
jgi:hypothetical protein